MPTPKTRLNRLNEILEMLKQNNGKMKFKEIYGRMALNHGVTLRTFWDYLASLKIAGKVDYSEIHVMGRQGDVEIRLVERVK